MFKTKNNIRKRVMSIIDKKIQEAQTMFDESLADLEFNFKKSMEDLKVAHEIKKVNLESAIVNDIIGKVI